MTKRLPENAVFRNLGENGPKAHFFCANGFSSHLYNPLLEKLSKIYDLKVLEMRPLWENPGNPPTERNWDIYADDLISYIDGEIKEPVVGFGHSMGATGTIIAASKRPDLFNALVLIEPAMVSKPLAIFAALMPKVLMNLIQPARGTLKKRDRWETKEAFIEECRKKKMFRGFNEKAFQLLSEYGVKKNNGYFELTYPKIWEAHNYTKPPNVMDKISKIKIPKVAIRAKPSVFFTESIWNSWKKNSPDTVFRENFKSGHLLPMENPEICFELICSGIEEAGLNNLL